MVWPVALAAVVAVAVEVAAGVVAGQFNLGQPHICMTRIHHKLDLECEAGPLKSFLTPICTDSRPASHNFL